MKLKKTNIEGLFVLKPFIFKDDRGAFVKTFNHDTYKELGLNPSIHESFYSVSNKNVLRGMHFQTPPHDLDKIVFVSNGRVLDVILDLRVGSPSYGESFSIELSYENNTQLYIPKGCAHGFLSLKDNSFIHYFQSAMYDQTSDNGVKYDSFGFDWGVKDPIISQRDQGFLSLNDFQSPFKYEN
ncbi:MAG: dTDP-4-keto-6-deoxy-D-glucose epimerase [Oligoflexia bacterium]|nr:dTDP-4-keto-6-deoxy-D-glucose epimerase [Oligoflexia bacterium]